MHTAIGPVGVTGRSTRRRRLPFSRKSFGLLLYSWRRSAPVRFLKPLTRTSTAESFAPATQASASLPRIVAFADAGATIAASKPAKPIQPSDFDMTYAPPEAIGRATAHTPR